MSARPGPTVRRRRLGAELRRIRETVRITAEEASSRLGWYKAKVSKVETGTITPGLGRIEGIKRQDGRWVVVTSRGLVIGR